MSTGQGASFTLAELADALGARLIGSPDDVVVRVAAPERAGPDAVTFANSAAARRALSSTKAAAVIASFDEAADRAHEFPCATLAAENPHLALARALELLHPPKPFVPGVDPRAVVDDDATLGADVTVGPFAVIGAATLGARVRVMAGAYIDDDVVVGDDVVIGPGCVLLHGTTVGARVILHPGTVLGADGFGYAPDGVRNVKVAQIGGVRIGDDVEIGALSCVDRGALGDTVVGDGTKIDNLVQLGHGVRVGEHAVLIAQTGVGGDTVIGDRALLAGQVGVAHELTIGDDARIGAKSGVTRSVPAGAAWSGYPAFAHGDWLKSSVRHRKLDDTVRRLHAAEDEIKALREELAALKSAFQNASLEEKES